MTTAESPSEPTLFDPRSVQTAGVSAAGDPTPGTREDGPALPGVLPPGEAALSERKRLEAQLEALKHKEFELRRALAVADHPQLADAIRAIEGRVFAVSRAEAKLAQGLSKSEARRREVLDKKLAALRDKRAELDAQISAFDSELAGIGTERLAAFESERHQALQQLLIALSTHEAELSGAGLDANALVPELAHWLPAIEALARSLSEPIRT